MSNDTMLGSLYLLMAVMLFLGALIVRRERAAKLAVMALAWVAIFGAGFVVLTFRDDLGYLGKRLKAEAFGTPIVEGREVRVPQAVDGHFYVDATINGRPVRFLVDSGATMTTIGRNTAHNLGVVVSQDRNQLVQTGNGVVRVARARADTMSIGPIERRNLGLHVADRDELNVLGMNFLSTLDRWTVERRWLVMKG